MNTTKNNKNRMVTVEQKVEQKKSLIDKYPFNSQVFIQNSKTGEKLFDDLKIIDLCDKEIREEWGYGVKDEDMQKWLEKTKELSKISDEVKNLGVEILANSKRVGDISAKFLKRQVRQYLQKKQIN